MLRRFQLSKQPSATSLPLNKGKAIASSMPNPNKDDVHPLVKETHDGVPEAVVEGPLVNPAVPAKPETTIETSVHPQDQDLGILAHDVTSAFVCLFLLFWLNFVLER